MDSNATIGDTSVTLDVSPDRLEARLIHRQGKDLEAPSPDLLLDLIRSSGILVDTEVKGRAAAYLKLIQNGGDEAIPDDYLLAKGKKPIEGEDESLEWDASFQQEHGSWQGDASINYYSYNAIITVEAGAIIGMLKPLVPARAGVDVFGETIKPNRQPTTLDVRESIRRDPDEPARLVAAIPGRVVQKDNRLFVDEVLLFKGDIDFSTGNVDATIDVNIKGNIYDKFKVKSAKSITVHGAIEAARVRAEADIVVRGGILGREEGSVHARGEITAKFCTKADICAERDIKIAKQMMNSRVFTNGQLIAEHAAIIGGVIYARQGLSVATLGSEADVPTRVVMGVHPRALVEAELIEVELMKTVEGVEKIRGAVRPLMQDVKRLTAAQKEKATELLFKADEAEMNMAESEQRRDDLIAGAGGNERPRCQITKTAHAGTTISIGKFVSRLDKELKGPIAIEQRKVENVTEIVGVNLLTGSIQVLNSIHVDPEELLEGFDFPLDPFAPEEQLSSETEGTQTETP